jgi:nucleoside 2-deoxyribosyltransferase
MRIYVAGASAEAEGNRAAIQKCRAMGYDCTHDWTRSVFKHRALGQSDAMLSQAERHGYAAGDLAGVRQADIFWLRVPKNGSTGAWIELGYALGLGKEILVSGDHLRSIFSALATVTRPTHDEALEWLRGRIRQ